MTVYRPETVQQAKQVMADAMAQMGVEVGMAREIADALVGAAAEDRDSNSPAQEGDSDADSSRLRGTQARQR